MADALLLIAACACALCGTAWLALAMQPHWAQAREAVSYSPDLARKLRVFGVIALGCSLAACLAADHATMASLVWVMIVSASAVFVAMTLAYRPRWLSWLGGMA